MSLDFRMDQTATEKPEWVVIGHCESEDFPRRAQAVAEHFGIAVMQKVDGLNERLWIASIGEAQFCISWDIWCTEVSIIAWEHTPDTESGTAERVLP